MHALVIYLGRLRMVLRNHWWGRQSPPLKRPTLTANSDDRSRRLPSGPWGRGSSWKRWESLTVFGLLLLTLSTRWPLRVMSLEEMDSALYALALQEFNLFKHQPQPPGYLFYIWAARLAQRWVHDPVQALATVQTVSGILSAPLFYGLLRPCMAPVWALSSTLLWVFSAQVWFQHVRPMEDAFAFLWMLGVVYLLVRSLWGDGRWWIGGVTLTGFSMGAKQVLPSFLVGLLLYTLWDQVRQRRFWTILIAFLGAALASLIWFVPLSLHVGSPQVYVALALGQLAWGREHDALISNLTPGRLHSQWATTFILIWGQKSLALPMWGLVAVGGWQVARSYPALHWLLWLVIPLVLQRFLFLGYWPRFSIYYLPFLLVLAVVGFSAVVRASVPLIERLTAADRQGPSSTLAMPRTWWYVLPVTVGIVGWTALQASYIGPALKILHREPLPISSVVQWLRQHYDPATTVIVTDNALLYRHLSYYAVSAGFSTVEEPWITPDALQGVQHIVKLQAKPIPPLSGELLGTWRVEVPHWRKLSQADDFLHVSLYVIRGPLLVFRNWHEAEFDGTHVARWSKPQGSEIWVYRAPPQDYHLHVQGEIPPLPHQPLPSPLMIRIHEELLPPLQGPRIDAFLQMQPTPTKPDWAVISIEPGCAFVPAQLSRSDDRRHLGCFYLTRIDIIP